jgi:hypothetical protein
MYCISKCKEYFPSRQELYTLTQSVIFATISTLVKGEAMYTRYVSMTLSAISELQRLGYTNLGAEYAARLDLIEKSKEVFGNVATLALLANLHLHISARCETTTGLRSVREKLVLSPRRALHHLHAAIQA